MKILYPLSETTPSYGGIGAYTYKIIDGLIKNYKDYEAVIATSNQQQEDTFSKYFDGIDRVKVISLFEHSFNQIFIRDLYFQLRLAKKIKKLIRKDEINIIHHQTGHCDLFFAINFLHDLPVIMTSHGDTFTLLEKWKSVKLRNINEKVNYYAGKILYQEEKVLYKKSNKIIAVADHVKAKIVKNYGIESNKIVTIYNFVDPEKFYFHPGKFIEPYKIGFIGRPYYIKGFYDLIKIINNSRNKDAFEWHLVTDANLVKRLVKNDENIYYYNNIPQSKLSEFYDDIDFMFIPSYSEACPTVVIESLLKGKLCISRDLTGIQEIMKDLYGYFFNDVSMLDLHDIFKTFTKNSTDLLESLKMNREKIKKRYGATTSIVELYNLYKSYI
ncbi:MAG: glycosyltransferase family 4 protein [Candidatus Thermoplasmatota archaeon]|jgi:glycosyltransferase involved in cell wall biosynthesis|nr:glycosyltransferase family 4 protein [Candidatus Thermoplasmatota archaeon]